jgi:hypothetical protein
LTPANFTHKSPQQQAPDPQTLPPTPQKLKTNADYQQLTQVVERIKQIVKGQAAGDGDVSKETKKVMDDASDRLIDIIHMVEGDRTKDE